MFSRSPLQATRATGHAAAARPRSRALRSRALHWRRLRATVAPLLALLLGTACLGGTAAVETREPWEGTWRLVRLGGQPLPQREGDTEVVAESVTFVLLGTGFITDQWLEHTGTSTARECVAWFGFTLSSTNRIVTGPSREQPPRGQCADGVTVREFVLDGDTLRSAGGDAFRLGTRARVYVRN